MYGKAAGAARVAELKEQARKTYQVIQKRSASLGDEERAKLEQAKVYFGNGRYAATLTLLNEIKEQQP
ncbi:MAG: hypothetical protein AAF614_05210 [Chloroflexota bacterium]